MLREGICTLLSRLVVPDRPVTEHLGVSRGRLNWMRANEELLWQFLEPVLNLTEEDLIQQWLYGVISIPYNPVTPESGIATHTNCSRIGLYIGFRMAEELLRASREHSMSVLLGRHGKMPWSPIEMQS